MTKEELDKLQNNPLYQAYRTTGRDSDGRLILDEITAHECEAAGYPFPVFKYPDGDDCGARPLGVHGTSAEGLKPNPNARYDSRYPGGFTDEEIDANISAFLYGEDGAPEDEPEFGTDEQEFGADEPEFGTDEPAKIRPLSALPVETVLQQITFGADFTEDELKSAGIEVLADNSGKDITDGGVAYTGHAAPKHNKGGERKAGTNWLFVERILGKGDEVWIATNRQQIIRYTGDRDLTDTAKIELHPLASERIIRTSDGINDTDIVCIVPNTLGKAMLGDRVYMGCYAITIKTDEGLKTKIGKHCDMAGCLEDDLKRSPSIDFRTDIKTYGLHGVQINISRAFGDEDECKEHKRRIVDRMRGKGHWLYNNRRTVTGEFETVKEYKAVKEFVWATGNGTKSVPVKSSDLLNDIWKCYEENGGRENGMVFMLK